MITNFISQHWISNIKILCWSDCKVSKFHIEERPTEYEKLTDGQEVSVEGASLKLVGQSLLCIEVI